MIEKVESPPACRRCAIVFFKRYSREIDPMQDEPLCYPEICASISVLAALAK